MNLTDERHKVIIRSSWVSIVGNALLSTLKLTVGFIAGSFAVLSDGVDSATDVLISVIMVFAARIMKRPPDQKYVYGYEKVESIATKILSLIIFYAGIQLLISSIQRIISSTAPKLPDRIAIYITLFSIVGKLGLALYQYRQGKKCGSSLLIANAKNMRNDVVISLGVLLGLFFTFILELPILDSITGLIISLFVIKTAAGIFIDSYVQLMDGVKDITVYDKIFKAVDMVPEASNPHRVRSRQIGNLYAIMLDIEVEGSITLNEAHNIANAVECKIKENIENIYDIVVHVEPKGKLHEDEKFGLAKNMK